MNLESIGPSFKYMYNDIPKGFWDDIQRFGTSEVIPLKQFKTLKTERKSVRPNDDYYLVLPENSVYLFFRELHDLLVIKKITAKIYINSIQIDSFRIYNPQFNKVSHPWKSIFKIPNPECDRRATFKQTNYMKYFIGSEDFFVPIDDKLKPVYQEFKGYTGRSKEELSTGLELGCYGKNSKGSYGILDYIFLSNLTAIEDSSGEKKKCFFATEDVIQQLKKEFEKLSAKYPDCKKFDLDLEFYENNLLQYAPDLTYNEIFESKASEANVNKYSFDCRNKELIEIRRKSKYPILNEKKRTRYIYDIDQEEIDRMIEGGLPRRRSNNEDDLPF